MCLFLGVEGVEVSWRPTQRRLVEHFNDLSTLCWSYCFATRCPRLLITYPRSAARARARLTILGSFVEMIFGLVIACLNFAGGTTLLRFHADQFYIRALHDNIISISLCGTKGVGSGFKFFFQLLHYHVSAT